MSEVTQVPSRKKSISLTIERKAAKADLFEKLTLRVSQLFACISGSAVIALMLLIVINGIKRAISTPILGTTEIAGWLAAISVSFALGYTQIHRGHVDIDILVVKFPRGLQKVLRILVSFISLIFFSIVGWQLFQYAISLSENNNVSQTLGVVFYPFVILSSIGFFVFVLVLLKDFLTECKGGDSNGSN